METRIKITGKFSITGREYKYISYDILNGEVHSLPQGALAQSETTGAIWRMTREVFINASSDEDLARRFPLIYVAPVDHQEAISEGDILRSITLSEDMEQA